MSEEKWIVGVEDDSDYFLVGPEMYPGIVAVPVVRVHDEKIAHLFSAAPELLDVVQSLEKRLNVAIEIGMSAREAFDSFYQEIVREAIVKATGD